jgi:L-amino acid N-acyltransferase YncA
MSVLHDAGQGDGRRGGIIIRPMTEADWEAFFPVFAEIVQAGETYAFPTFTSPDEARPWWFDPSGAEPSVTVVAVDEDTGELLGSAKSGANRPGRGSHVSTASFMVAPAARGRGVGRLLGEWVLDWAREQGFASMQFNAVVETNTAAVALWKDLGFEVIGTVPEAFESRSRGRVGLHVMHRYL